MNTAPEEEQKILESLEFEPECYPHRNNRNEEVVADWWIKGMNPCCDKEPRSMFICGQCLARGLMSMVRCGRCRKWYPFHTSVIEYRRLK